MTQQNQSASLQYRQSEETDGNAPVTILICEDPVTDAYPCPVRAAVHEELTNLGYGDRVLQPDFDAMGIDSLDCLQLVAAVEDRYDIIITQADMIDLQTIDQLVAIVKRGS